MADERYIQSKLLERSRQTQLDLRQLPKAEANIAVAAASISARAQFLTFLERLSKSIGRSIPKGSSDPRIIEVGRSLVARHGSDYLGRLLNCTLTTQKILIPNSEMRSEPTCKHRLLLRSRRLNSGLLFVTGKEPRLSVHRPALVPTSEIALIS